MRRGLLLAAFIATLVLDMGGGPVFIVFAALYLKKEAMFSETIWLLVRGILNIVQFVTVMVMCITVNKVKQYYSTKEERLVVANLLTTSPTAYFYYVTILGGVIWNILGCWWIISAYEDYGKAFGTCYLVCIILSWVSTTLSPIFVFSGGLVYNRKKSDAPTVQNSAMDHLLTEDDAVFDIKKVIDKLNGDGHSLSVDDILWRDRFIGSDTAQPKDSYQDKEPITVIVSEDVHPITVTDIPPLTESSVTIQTSNPLLDDLAQEFNPTSAATEPTVVIQPDVLDDDGVHKENAVYSTIQNYLQKQREREESKVLGVHVQENIGLHVQELNETPSGSSRPTSASPHHSPVSTVNSESMQTLFLNAVNAGEPEMSMNSARSPKKYKESKSEKTKKTRNAKENTISVDELFGNIPVIMNAEREMKQHSEEHSEEFMDLSEQMIQEINHKKFEMKPSSDNVNVTYLG